MKGLKRKTLIFVSMYFAVSLVIGICIPLENNLGDNGLKFAFHNSYGYTLTCTSGIWTALRAGVHMKLPLLVQVSTDFPFGYQSEVFAYCPDYSGQ